uniref:Ig-like domain-containing protein n=1 Tax=Hucho hucho TaxID=62062 RepID=A0A4W5PN32_9TELE
QPLKINLVKLILWLAAGLNGLPSQHAVIANDHFWRKLVIVCQGRSETGNKQHSLVCFVNNFCPPPVQVKWTKNDENVPKGGKVGQYATNSDYTFYRFSPLTFEPQEGDIYTCIVDHTNTLASIIIKWKKFGSTKDL